MEVANARAMNVKSSAKSTNTKRKLNSQDHILLPSSSSSTSSKDLPTKRCRIAKENVESFGTTSSSISNGGYSTWKRCSSEICSRNFEVMESLKTKASTVAVVSGGAMMLPAEEIEEFFSVAEKYEQNRFKNKYNYDIVKDVPLEGRYQWIHIKQ